MRQSLSEPIEETSNAPGRVEVTRAVSASAIQVWQALTEPGIVAQWFGTLSSPLSVGESTHLEFGDGDFFLLNTIRFDPPFILQYAWRFLGIGPLDTITWRIVPKERGCLVTVTDCEPERTREAALLLRKGWMDFTNRLEKFLRKGKPTRYRWRHEFDGSIELAGNIEAVWHLLFKPKAQAQWLPLSGSVLEAGACFTVDDGIEPTLFQIIDVDLDPPTQVLFHLTHKDWLHPTNCNLELRPRGLDTMLTVSHDGWEAISLRDDYQKQQRKRFSLLWITTLRRAQRINADHRAHG